MDIDAEKVQQAVLALLHLNTFELKSGKRAWKALPWNVMDQLHDKVTFPIRPRKPSPCAYQMRGLGCPEDCLKVLCRQVAVSATAWGKARRLRSGPVRTSPVTRLERSRRRRGRYAWGERIGLALRLSCDAAGNLMQLALLMTLYGTGMRRMEAS